MACPAMALMANAKRAAGHSPSPTPTRRPSRTAGAVSGDRAQVIGNMLQQAAIVQPEDRVIAIVGNYGSGKTELAVNLALELSRAGRRVQIADLDLVNPYFRCRDARELMESHGIRVVVPPGAQAWADLPILLPEIRGMLRPPDGTVTIFDVGGDDAGARALASFRTSVAEGDYQLWQVINAKRPFTDTVAGCLAMRRTIEQASRWTVTALAINAHLIDETTIDTVLDGWRLAVAMRAETRLPIRFVAAMERLADSPALGVIDAPILRLRRHMLPPWLQPARVAADPAQIVPAARPIPIGRPGHIAFASAGEPHGPNRH